MSLLWEDKEKPQSPHARQAPGSGSAQPLRNGPRLASTERTSAAFIRCFRRSESIVARFKILKRFNSHAEAAAWYREKVAKSRATAWSLATRRASQPHIARRFKLRARLAATLKEWNNHYQRRTDTIPVFLACEIVWKELVSPPNSEMIKPPPESSEAGSA